MIRPSFLRNEPSRGTGCEAGKRAAFACRAELLGGGIAVNITEDVCKYTAEQGVSDPAASRAVWRKKAREFLQKGAELYQSA